MGEPRSLLITGGAGFIGANFVRHWRRWRPADALTVVDALTYAGDWGRLDGLEDTAPLRREEVDVRDADAVRALLARDEADIIVHFAAETHVDRSIRSPGDFVSANIEGTASLLEAARDYWMGPAPRRHRFHHISTDEVYGSLGPGDAPTSESAPYRPASPYAASKAAADHLVRAWHRTFGLDVCITACSNNFGPFQHPEKLIPKSIECALHGREIPVYGDGSNRRDWLYVAEHCRVLAEVVLRGRNGATYNIGAGNELDNNTLLMRLCAAIDGRFADDASLAERFPNAPAARGEPSAGLLRYVPDRPGHDWRYALDCARLSSELGLVVRSRLDEEMARTLDWHLCCTDAGRPDTLCE